jgi:hypothetical protein
VPFHPPTFRFAFCLFLTLAKLKIGSVFCSRRERQRRRHEADEIQRQIRAWVTVATHQFRCRSMIIWCSLRRDSMARAAAMRSCERRATMPPPRRRLPPTTSITTCTFRVSCGFWRALLIVDAVCTEKCDRKSRSNEDDDNNTTNTDDSDGNKPKKDKWGFEIEGKGNANENGTRTSAFLRSIYLVHVDYGIATSDRVGDRRSIDVGTRDSARREVGRHAGTSSMLHIFVLSFCSRVCSLGRSM